MHKGIKVYTLVARSWSNDNTFIHVDIDTFPDSHQPPNQEREVEIVPPSPIDNSRGSNENVQNPLNEDKIDVKWPPESEIHPVSGEGIKDKKDPNQENGGKLKEGEKGGEDEREGAERPVADGDDQGMFISQLTEAGVRKKREREKGKGGRWGRKKKGEGRERREGGEGGEEGESTNTCMCCAHAVSK